MTEQKLIVVLGATGAQGGGLARAILNDPDKEFSVRVLSRNKNSDKAKALEEMGAEVVEADIDNPESLKEAFKGAYGAFCVTFFWEHFSAEKEKEQVKNMAEAAKANNLQHVVWSTLEDTRKWVPLEDDRMPTLGEKYKVPHFDGKGEADQYFKDAGVPTTFLLTSFYWDNFIYFGMGPQKGEDGNLYLNIPMGDKKLPGIAAEDIGKCAFGIFKRANEFLNQYVGISGEHLTGQQMASAFSELKGADIKYNAVPFEIYRKFDFPGADDLGNMFQFKHDFNEDFCKARTVELSRELNPELLSFNDWLKKYQDKL